MKELQERIKKDGIAINEDILKVDSFINHQVDPELMAHIGAEFADHFKNRGITKVATIESSGIAKVLNDNLFQTEVTSFTKGTSYELTLSSKFIGENDHVLIIDDFLANGEAATGAIRLLRKAHATVGGIGILIEKAFQPGHDKLVSQGFDVYSLARIGHMSADHIEFIE